MTGGGTNCVVFSKLEERIIALAGIETAVVGIQARDFGAANYDIDEINETANIADDVENTSAGPSIPNIQRPAPKRRRVTTQAMVLQELKVQRKVNEAFQGSMIQLLTQSNEINAKRLKAEEELLQLKKQRQTIEFS